MQVKFKPMLAYTVEDLDKVEYPVYVSPKLDGIRAIVLDGVVYSRSMKPIRSKAVQALFGREEYNGFDGELIYGYPTEQDVFNKSTSFCMSKDTPEGMNKDDVWFYVFDIALDCNTPYYVRSLHLKEQLSQIDSSQVVPVYSWSAYSAEDIKELEEYYLNLGYEGVMLNSPNGLYKQGRSTAKEGYLGKLKRFSDSEAIVIGFEEQLHNTNEAKTNELGYTERSTSKDGMIGANTLGTLIVTDIHSGVEFGIGSGFDANTRQIIWDNREDWLGAIVKYKFFAIQSAYNKPRFPIFLGVRDKDDM